MWSLWSILLSVVPMERDRIRSALNSGPLGLAEERMTGLQPKVYLKFCKVF